jgi:hypothetical protein
LPVIQTVFDTNPDAILQPDFCGEMPLYMLFRPHMDCRILEHVLNRNPSLALFQQERRFSGAQSLLQTLCSQWVDVIRNNEMVVASSSASNNSSSKEFNESVVPITRRRVHSDCKLLDRWTKLVLTARAAHRMTHPTAAGAAATTTTTATNTADATTKASPQKQLLTLCEIPDLHIALQLECRLPPVILCQFIEMYPEQASKLMSRNNNANATILQTNSRVVGNIDIDRSTKRMRTEDDATSTTSRVSDEDDHDDSTSNSMMLPLHYFLSEYPTTRTTTPRTMTRTCVSDRFVPVCKRGSPLQHLIRAFPEAASILHSSLSSSSSSSLSPHRGSRRKQQHNLPLHMAIASGIPWTNGLRELVYANPSALGIKDETTQLASFLQQATKQQACCHQQHERDGDERMVVANTAANNTTTTTTTAAAATTTSCQTATMALNTVFRLLREDPSVLSRMIAP